MNSILREKAIKLRLDKELSYSAIQKELKVSKSTLSYWLRDLPLSREKVTELRRIGWEKGETSRERFRITMREKKEKRYQKIYKEQRKNLKKLSRQTSFVAGLMLYLGEGNKKEYTKIALANTDPRIVTFFVLWLKDFLGIEAKDMRAELHLYENMDIAKEEKFWQDTLSFSRKQFYKTQVRKIRNNSFSYRESYRHGTCSLSVLGVKKKEELMAAMQAFLDLYMKNARV